MTQPRIPVAGPWVTEKEVAYVADAAAGDWYGQAGRYTQRFENAFANYIRVPHTVSVPNCTAALHLALAGLGVGPGDEVILPDVTWIATAAPVQYVGATPVFADMDPGTWCITPASVEECITTRTRAVITVDLYGSIPDMDALSTLAGEHGIAVIEDAAEAIGSEYHGRAAGSLGDAGAFSFHGSKTLTTGEGGMLVTASAELQERVLFLRDHGRSPGDRYFCNAEVGFKYKMSSLQAAFGLAQLERVDELVDRKRSLFGWYAERLGGIDGVSLNIEPAGTKNSYWMVTVVLDPGYGVTGRELMDFLDENWIDTRPFFHPLSSLPAFNSTEQAGVARRRNSIAYRVSPYGLNLPSALALDEGQVDRVCDVVRKAIGR